MTGVFILLYKFVTFSLYFTYNRKTNNMKAESFDILKEKLVKTYRKYGDKACLTIMGANGIKQYTGNEVANEIEQETEFGVNCIHTLIGLTVDLISRDRMKYEVKKEHVPQTKETIDTNIPIKLTNLQIETLYNVSGKGDFFYGKSMRSLHVLESKGLVYKTRKANGEFWEITDKGLSELNKLKLL